MTERTNASHRIREALGEKSMTLLELCQYTGMSRLGAKSTVNAMCKRKELRVRFRNGEANYVVSHQPLSAQEGGV